jgi:hypothetical protein
MQGARVDINITYSQLTLGGLAGRQVVRARTVLCVTVSRVGHWRVHYDIR